MDKIIVNGADLPEAQITRTGGQASFTHPVTLVEGTNVFDIIAWDTAHCALESRKLIVNWRKGPPAPPPDQARGPTPPAERQLSPGHAEPAEQHGGREQQRGALAGPAGVERSGGPGGAGAHPG